MSIHPSCVYIVPKQDISETHASQEKKNDEHKVSVIWRRSRVCAPFIENDFGISLKKAHLIASFVSAPKIQKKEEMPKKNDDKKLAED